MDKRQSRTVLGSSPSMISFDEGGLRKKRSRMSFKTRRVKRLLVNENTFLNSKYLQIPEEMYTEMKKKVNISNTTEGKKKHVE